jgi:hypothetical protein
LKRYMSSVAAIGLLAASLIVAQPAHAVAEQVTATCSFDPPSRISISQTVNRYHATLASNCPASVYTAVWKSTPIATTSTQGRLEFLYGSRMVGFNVVGINPPIGTVTWKPAGAATNVNGVKVADLATATSVSKCASAVALSGSRKAARTALLTTVSHWNPAAGYYVRWANKTVLIQYQEIGTSTWKGLAYVTTNSVGQVIYNYYPNRTRRYRVYVPGTSSVWNIFSPVISR